MSANRRTINLLRDRVAQANSSAAQLGDTFHLGVGLPPGGIEFCIGAEGYPIATDLPIASAHRWLDGWVAGVTAALAAKLTAACDPSKVSASEAVQSVYNEARVPARR